MHTPESLQPVLVIPRGPLDILKKVLGMHAQVVTKPSLATSGQLTIRLKGLAHAKIIKKSVILFRVLNMTI